MAAWRLGIPVLPLEEDFTRPEHERRTHLHRQFAVSMVHPFFSQCCSMMFHDDLEDEDEDDDDDDDDDSGHTIIPFSVSYMFHNSHQHLFPYL